MLWFSNYLKSYSDRDKKKEDFIKVDVKKTIVLEIEWVVL